jgi:transcription antitermination factor NusG
LLSPVAELRNALSWYAIRTKPNHEKASFTILTNKGYQSYLPAYSERRRWSDRTVIVERPLFPGYLFSRFDPIHRMPILTATGVISVLGFGGDLHPIPQEEIDGVKTVLRSGLAVQACPFLREGQRIRVSGGALQGLEGVLLRQKSEWRIVVSVTLLQRSISVEIDRNLVLAI